MKKTLMAVIVMVSSAFLFARTGIGIQGGAKIDMGVDHVEGMSIRSDRSPWGISLDCNFKDKSADLILDDWWIVKRLSNNVNLYTFWGMSFGARLENEWYGETGMRLGGSLRGTGSRVGAGVDVFLFKSRCLEFFAQAAWNPSIGANWDSEEDELSLCFRPACFPVNGGIRLWFGN